MSVLAVLDRPDVARQSLPVVAASALPFDTVVLKFGSSILRGPDDAPAAVSEIYRHVRAGRRVVAVVSAFAGETDRLLGEARALGLAHENALLPAYVAMGEERAAALVAIACDRVGLDAVALSVRDLGIEAEGPSEHARPKALRDGPLKGGRLREALARHEVVIAPGFGAVRADDRVALLGRGGSDLTAVFLAAELGLDRVRLIKDVDGLYDRDPAGGEGAPLRYRQAGYDTARLRGGALVQRDAIDLAEQAGLAIEVAALGHEEATVIAAEDKAPRPVRPEAPVRVAVAGCGVVGGGLLSRLLGAPDVEVVGVLVRDPAKPRDVDCPPGLFTADPADLLARGPEVVLEALSDGQAGHALMRAALACGIDVVSANKQAVSLDPAGLEDLARANGARILWSASVGGGAPMIETIRAARAAGPVVAFEAVLNGTVNFMLERLGRGAAFDEALAAARVAGFAEEDPSADLEGRDSEAKVKLLAYEAFGAAPELSRRDVLAAHAVPAPGVRQIGACRARDGELEVTVSLDDAADDPFFLALGGERNALKVTGADGRVWTCKGRGAGRWATTESVMADLGDIIVARRAAD